MLDHVETVFENMKPMMKKLKKVSYKQNMEAFVEDYGHYFREMTELTEKAENKNEKAKEIAKVFAESVEHEFASSKNGRISGPLQLDLNFFMIYYVFPAILMTEHEDAVLIADQIRDEWGNRFKDSKIQYTDYDSLYGAFREKIFGIF
ncbi:hypothetical protein [[Ruminococcus] torques]|jgi:hypothetical protein|uniref:hypothetical protein n=1 Tax=[Ruminococcus] torques TaxID=33039 RepID=UPI0015BD2AD2|nr:hypothetical protein [[Ruminococcus] torques]MBS5398296.1 hypothetical protein [Lachnospiraceae bacterium]MDM8235458.1 hypothetical protein [[Ruminococcus] torques]HJA18919.1 hypothetical protein [Candidatus Mediterraneibacter ornithocaccae]HJC81095.1 hypothetical protein [Candidatus Mediterraneibacter excrementipullorum]